MQSIKGVSAVRQRTVQRFLVLMAVVFVGGVIVSAWAADDKTWVQRSISDLGIDTTAWIIFNGTMVLLGLVSIPAMRALRHTIREDLFTQDAMTRMPLLRHITNGLLLAPFAMMGIGLIPYRVNVHVHNAIAVVLLLSFSLNMLALALKGVVKQQQLRLVSGAILAVIILATFTYGFDQLGYVEYEFFLAGMIALWIYLVGRHYPAALSNASAP